MSSAAPPRRRRLRLAAAWSAGLVVLVAAVLIAGAPDEGRPLDPGSTGPQGLRGVVDLLEALDVEVTVDLDPPTDTDTRVFVPLDLLGPDRRDALRDWVDDGGTLVVAGADARLHGLLAAGAPITDVVGPVGRAPDCDLPGLAPVGQVVHADWEGLRAPDERDHVTCFGGEEVAWLVAAEHGEGTVVALGSAAPFVNAELDEADNAVLAAALLAPDPGDRLRIVPRPPVGEGESGLADLIPRRVWEGLALLLAAVLLGVLWRARRLGRPVPEALPPVVPAAELPRSLGQLLQRSGSRQGAADRLRADARRTVARTLALPLGTPAERLTDLAVHRLGLDAEQARRALVDAPVPDDEELVAVARATRRVVAASHRWTTSNDSSVNRFVDMPAGRRGD